MIATCPGCGKRYRIADDAIPPGGRHVRCVACGVGWMVGAGSDAPAPGAPPPAGRPVPPTAQPMVPIAEPDQAATSEPPAGPLVAPRAVAEASPTGGRPPPITGFEQALPQPRRLPVGWIAAAVALLAAAALAVVEFAPERTFDPPRLGLPAARLPHVDTASLPPLDLTRVPVVGSALDALAHPRAAPPSPLRITAIGERHRLANGTWLLTVAGTIANPTGAAVAVTGIDAALVDRRGKVGLRWRILPPVGEVPAHGRAPFESTAANFPAAATTLRLTPR